MNGVFTIRIKTEHTTHVKISFFCVKVVTKEYTNVGKRLKVQRLSRKGVGHKLMVLEARSPKQVKLWVKI